MPKKKNVASGFGLLMLEMQEKKAKSGYRIPLSQMKTYADPVWKAMSAEEKAMYNKEAKLSRRCNGAQKLASDGTVIESNIHELEESEAEEKQMISDITLLVTGGEKDTELAKLYAMEQNFYVMSFNILCCTEEDIFIPLEVSIAEYSVKYGITKQFHKFIHPGSIPLGYSGEAKHHSDDTHQICINGHPDSDKNYISIMEEIENFVNPDNKAGTIPVFSAPNQVEQTQGCLSWLYCKTGFGSEICSKDLSYLLMQLCATAGSPLVSLIFVYDYLKQSTFDYAMDSRCDFHEELDSVYCTLGCVKKLCYLMSDKLCSCFEVEATDMHLPKRTAFEKQYQVFNPSSSKPQKEVRPRQTVEPPQSKASGLFDLDDYSDEESSSARNLCSTMRDMKLNAATSTGQGIGRGRPRK